MTQHKKYYQISDIDFIEAVKSSLCIREALEKMGYAAAGAAYKVFHLRVKQLGLDTSHFTGQGHLKNKTHNWTPSKPLEEIMIANSDRIMTAGLKKRILKAGLLESKCQLCGLTDTWNGQPIVLQLDHINGDHFDHRIENLRLLCPNCHSQTDTFCSKNPEGKVARKEAKATRKAERKTNAEFVRQQKAPHTCKICGVNIHWDATYCRGCYATHRKELQPDIVHATKIVWPSPEEILERLKTTSYLQLGKELGITDNAIRKYLKRHQY